MLSKKTLLLSLLFLFSINFYSQTNQGKQAGGTPVQKVNSNVPFPGEPCASSYLDDYLKRTDPVYRQNRINIEAQTQAFATSRSGATRGTVYTIPVVFHIMHSGEALGDSTNITLAQCQSAIAALNRDFRRTAADGGIANSGPLGTDAEIEFCIAQKDPSGNYTTGVTRHDMSGNQAYLDSGVYHTASLWRSDFSMKSSVNWDHTKYMNVWVVNKIRNLKNIYSSGYTGGVQGYAYFPGASSPYDGVVMVSSAVGNDPLGSFGYNLWSVTKDNRVFTHEVGHYLNLYHTFQSTSACAGASGAMCSTIGDRCCDTPPTVVGSGNTCVSPNIPCPLSNKENYMAYYNRACAADFTPNQVTRMRAVLASGGVRHALTQTTNCIAPPSGLDIKLDSILYPTDTICDSNFIPEIIVCNVGTDTIKAFKVDYDLDLGPTSTYSWTGVLDPNDCDTILLPMINSTPGSHFFRAIIQDTLNNSTIIADSDLTNNGDSLTYFSTGGVITKYGTLSGCDSVISPAGTVWKNSGIYYDTVSSATCDTVFCYTVSLNYAAFGDSTAFEWAKGIGGAGGEEGFSIIRDKSENVYVTGYFSGTVDFDPGAGTTNLFSAGNIDIFITKFDSSGNFIWAKSVGGTGNDFGKSINLDSYGNIYLTGYFNNTVDFDPGVGSFSMTSAGNFDIFILKLDGSGNFVWSKQIGGSGIDIGRSLTIDNNNNILTTGYFSGTVDFDPGTPINSLTSISVSKDIFISKLDENGNYLWAKRIGGANEDGANYINTDDSGNVYTTGYFNGTVDFDPSSGGTNNITSGGIDIFISKLDASGNFVWAKKLGGAGSDYGYSIEIDDNGNVFTSGSFSVTADFNPNIGINNLTSSGSFDMFISKLDMNGNYIWAKKMGGTLEDVAVSLKLDNVGNIYTTGYFNGTCDFNPGAGINNLISFGLRDVFVSKLDINGNYIFSKQIGGSSNDLSYSLEVDNFGNIYTTGGFHGTADFNQDTGTFNLNSAGGADIFIHKMSQSIISIDTACTSFTSPTGKIWTTTGNYADTLTNSSGCEYDGASLSTNEHG